MASQGGAILAIDAGLEGVGLRAEMQAMELGRMQAVVQGSWQQAEQRISEEMDRRMAQMGKKLVERDAHFLEATQRLANEAGLADVMESQRFVRTQEDVSKVREQLAALETEKRGEDVRMKAAAHAVERASEEAANANHGLREATRALGDLGAAVQEQQSANQSVREWIDRMEKCRAREIASMEGALADHAQR